MYTCNETTEYESQKGYVLYITISLFPCVCPLSVLLPAFIICSYVLNLAFPDWKENRTGLLVYKGAISALPCRNICLGGGAGGGGSHKNKHWWEGGLR